MTKKLRRHVSHHKKKSFISPESSKEGHKLLSHLVTPTYRGCHLDLEMKHVHPGTPSR